MAAFVVLVVPALANANSSVDYNGVNLTYTGEDAVNNVASVSLDAAATTFTITDSENISTASPGCTGSGTTTVTCTATDPGDNSITMGGGGGNDTLNVDTSAAPAASQPDSVEVGNSFEAGNDHIDLSKYTRADGDSEIIGGPGDDVETAAPDGTDFFMGATPDGADTLFGGPGKDHADYEERTADLVLNAADGLPNDGEAGEHDNIGANVEELDGGVRNDKLTAGPDGSDLRGGDGNDTVTGGPGSDNLEGDNGSNVISGEAGDDFIFGGFNNSDTIDGGPGDDFIEVANGGDDLHGGAGFDFVLLSDEEVAMLDGFPPPPNLSVTLDDVANDGAGGQGMNVHSDIEDIETGSGNDNVVGSDAPEEIFTQGGNDVVNPGGGSDQVETGAGSDTVTARDGIFDRISCGDGTDSATVDDLDALSGCENVSSMAVPVIQGPRDRKAAKVTVSRLAKHLARKKFLKGGFSLRVTPSEPVRLFFTLTGHARGARISRAGDIVVATKSVAQSGKARTVRLKPSRHMRFARHFKLRLQLLAIDAGGNPTNVSRTIAVK